MPTIKSKRTGLIQFIDSKAWEDLKRLDKAKYHTIIDDGDLQDTIIPAPVSIMELHQSDIKPEKIANRNEIKAQLNEKDIEYNTRASTNKLLELLNNK